MKHVHLHGPIEKQAWPEALTARVVDATDASRRIHGFEVEADLARNYSFAEVALLSLTGEAPSREAGLLFERVLVLLAPISVGQAPAHVGVLAKLCGARSSAIAGATGLSLAEQGALRWAEHASLRDWLAAPSGPYPEAHRARNEAERARVALVRAAVSDSHGHLFSQDPTVDAALHALLHACGIVREDQFVAVWQIARLPCALAEAFSVQTASFRDYPMTLPPFEYVEDRS